MATPPPPSWWASCARSSRRQHNLLTAAIKEYGALRRSIYARYLADESYRRKIARQLNKGENLHPLRRELAYAGQGAVGRHHHDQQTDQMWCLTVATNAIVTWTSTANSPNSPSTATGRCAARPPATAQPEETPL